MVAVVFLVTGAVSTDVFNWTIPCGGTDNLYPYGNDWKVRFGVDQNGTWDYDVKDAVHPPIGDPDHDLGFILSEDYSQIYLGAYGRDNYGWPPPWGRHGGGDVPDYPSPGLLKDTRAPITEPGEPEFWLAKVYVPNAGYTFSFVWSIEHDFPLQAVVAKVWGNPDFEAAGWYGDLILTDRGRGDFKLAGIPQWGQGAHNWVIEAHHVVPEPAVGQLAGLALGLAGLVWVRLRRK